ncbi:hypothetical protein SAMN06265784_113111 [Paraburkholderia susongensis]|uniref:Uncharacterized protein n=1 Tax=Paraburkholderia susongensis TaxID=1515439 RepID=A0A1X7M062_9BURK|nr:hypothetical protein SAMN06265784_113111 [Paraburkholderia susongensis]
MTGVLHRDTLRGGQTEFATREHARFPRIDRIDLY